PADYDRIEQGDVVVLDGLRDGLRDGLGDSGRTVAAANTTKDERYELAHHLSPRQVEVVLAGGLIPALKAADQG
ncbi:MAG: aconitate hydratase, partial [Acidimicrobiia bacterium]|nr:aconitate hydratase [Acidimicrobiia bacterium]